MLTGIDPYLETFEVFVPLILNNGLMYTLLMLNVIAAGDSGSACLGMVLLFQYYTGQVDGI